MATKEQERKALEQIKKIIAGIGGDESYIGKAFEGCFEMAEDNISNDFWNSWKDKYEIEHKTADKAVDKLNDKAEENILLKKELDITKKTMKEESERAGRLADDLKAMKMANEQNIKRQEEQKEKAEALQMEVIKLKARLFDMMEAQGAK